MTGWMKVVGIVVATIALLSTQGVVDARAPATARPAASARCSDAAIREIHLGHEEYVDQIWVELKAPAQDDKGTVKVEVSAGRSARRLIVAEMGVRGLRFSPGLHGDTFRVALDPDFGAATGACVARIVLLRDGAEIASVTP